METKDMLERILKREELSPADQIEVLGLIRARATESASFDFLMKRELLSVEEKIELLGKLVSEKAQKILAEEYLLASMGVNEQVDILLSGDTYVPPKNVEKFLRLLGAREINIKAADTCGDDYYHQKTKVIFRV